jgi:hypothetical protein
MIINIEIRINAEKIMELKIKNALKGLKWGEKKF